MSTPTSPKPGTAIAPITKIKDYITARRDNLMASMKGTGISVDRFMTLALNQTLNPQTGPLLLQCTPASWFDALQKAATHGLLPDGIHAALIPYKFSDKKKNTSEYRVQFQTMAQGLVQRAYQTGVVTKMWAEPVYENDEFSVTLGDDPKLVHIPSPDDRNDNKLRAVYACAKVNGEVHFKVLFPRDVKRHENASKTADNESSPWKTATPEMWKKTAMIVLSKELPHFKVEQQRYAALIDDDTRENLPEPIDVQFLPEPEPTPAIEGVKERLRAQQPATAAAPPPQEPAPHSTTPEEAAAAFPEAEREPGADDAEEMVAPEPAPPPPCQHKSLWNMARSADQRRKLLCPDCDVEVSPSVVQIAERQAKG